MAITYNTVPYKYSSEAKFNISGSTPNNGTTVFNSRVESTLLIGQVEIAKKIKPYGLNVHDWSKILKTYINFTTPALPNSVDVALNEGGKVGNNLITSISNFLPAFDTFTSAANAVSVASCTTSHSASYNSNQISVTAGKTYVIMIRGANITGSNLVVGEYTSYGMELLNVSIAIGETEKRLYVQFKTSGANMQLNFSRTASIGVATASFYMFELAPCDWYVPYCIKAVEKWEDASGVTQTDTVNYNSLLFMFFESSLPEASFVNYYVPGGVTNKWLNNTANENKSNITKYFGQNYENSVKTYSNRVSGTKSECYITSNCGSYINSISIKVDLYNADGTFALTKVALADTLFYAPIFIISFDDLIVKNIGTYYPYGLVYINVNNTASRINEYIPVLNDTTFIKNHVSLVWKNNIGGLSSKVLYTNRSSEISTYTEKYKTSSNLSKVFYSEKVKSINVQGLTTFNDGELDFMTDIMESDMVYINTAQDVFTPINILNTSMQSETIEESFIEIDFEYVP